MTGYIEGLMQACNISIALAIKILQSWTEPSIWMYEMLLAFEIYVYIRLVESLTINCDKFTDIVMDSRSSDSMTISVNFDLLFFFLARILYESCITINHFAVLWEKDTLKTWLISGNKNHSTCNASSERQNVLNAISFTFLSVGA